MFRGLEIYLDYNSVRVQEMVEIYLCDSFIYWKNKLVNIQRKIYPIIVMIFFSRALEIAMMHKKHVDTVLWKRHEYLLSTNQKEPKEAFQKLVTEVEPHHNVTFLEFGS